MVRSSAKAELRLMIRVDRRVNVVAADGRDNEIMSFVKLYHLVFSRSAKR